MSLRISRLFATAMLIVSAVGMLTVSFDAQARRMGGGSSFGRQSANITQKRQAVTPPAASTAVPRAAAPAAAGATGAAAGAAAAKSGMSRWLGPIAGIAAGLGIAALLSHLGLSGAFLEMLSSLVLIGIVLFGILYIVRRIRGMQPAATLSRQGAAGPVPGSQPLQRQAPAPAAAAGLGGSAAAPAAPVDSSWYIPGDFDTVAFLSQAKARFIEIQAIWDSGDVNKLREYLTDDLVAELKPQILARSGATRTEVVLLNAELLGIEAVSGGHLASVRYSGMLRESTDTEAFRFEEVWNLYKGGDSGWLLAGIQQIPLEYAS
ncbi:Tim44 domain-containing protein [Candidimonas humi]|uniref:Tim44 domain-containing protein n=2 Tax=Candidimonas humi TaxID=683355 RepID=A0ABV8P016_9BURK